MRIGNSALYFLLGLSLAAVGCNKKEDSKIIPPSVSAPPKQEPLPPMEETPKKPEAPTPPAPPAPPTPPVPPGTPPQGGDCAAPGVGPIRSTYCAKEITKLCDAAIASTEQQIRQIVETPASQQNLDNTLLAFEKAMADLNDASSALTFMNYVSKDENLRSEGGDCEQRLGQYTVDVYTRRALYDVLARQKSRDAGTERLLGQTLLSFESNGLKLNDSDLSAVKQLTTELSKKESQFSTNLNEDASSVQFTAEELQGASASFLQRLKKNGDKYIVTTKSTDYLEVMQNVTVAESRKKLMLAYFNRGGIQNTQLLEEAILLREQIAQKLGYATWADSRTANRMAKTGAKARQFLVDLKDKLAQRNQQDFAQLMTFKKELDPNAKTLDQWDIPYLTYQLQKRDYSLDNDKIREYFPADTVVAGIFSVYSEILGLRFQEVSNATVWSEGVKLYEIREKSDDHLIGYFYTDLIPRQGKYGHAAAFNLISGRVLADGSYSKPASAIVANFTPPSDGLPSLLTHDEVETFFHEFGHIMHQTLTKAPYASLSGSSVARDFVEAPSQMLENWIWNAGILSRISGHYQRPQEKLPQEMLEKMVAVRNFQQGVAYTKQLLYALFDMTIHTQNGAVDVTETYNNLYRQIIGQEPIAGNHFAGTFGHMMGGYDAGYYGYLWSQVYSADMFTKFPENDLTNAEVGARYRRTILEQGNMKESLDLLREFLGREPNSDAFFKKIGL